jgi:hypothetical protein
MIFHNRFTPVFLEDRWQLMGAMETLNGWLLFGLSTVFLFGRNRQNRAVTPQRKQQSERT